MENNDCPYVVRIAEKADAPRLLEIYSYYVENTAITFEFEVPSVAEFESRIEGKLEKFPYIVCMHEGLVVGYAYAGSFRTRPAYDWSVETSIYVDRAWHGKGVGRRLYEELERLLVKQNIVNLYACISCPPASSSGDERLDYNSIHFHEHMGYRMEGRLSLCGCKFDTWYDLAIMVKNLTPHPVPAGKVIAFPMLTDIAF